jgi:nucleolin
MSITFQQHSLCVPAAYDNETGKARGFAHVAFNDTSGAAKAIALSGTEFGGRQVYIDSARERGQGGGAGGGAGGTPGTGGHLAM